MKLRVSLALLLIVGESLGISDYLFKKFKTEYKSRVFADTVTKVVVNEIGVGANSYLVDVVIRLAWQHSLGVSVDIENGLDTVEVASLKGGTTKLSSSQKRDCVEGIKELVASKKFTSQDGESAALGQQYTWAGDIDLDNVANAIGEIMFLKVPCGIVKGTGDLTCGSGQKEKTILEALREARDVFEFNYRKQTPEQVQKAGHKSFARQAQDYADVVMLYLGFIDPRSQFRGAWQAAIEDFMSTEIQGATTNGYHYSMDEYDKYKPVYDQYRREYDRLSALDRYSLIKGFSALMMKDFGVSGVTPQKSVSHTKKELPSHRAADRSHSPARRADQSGSTHGMRVNIEDALRLAAQLSHGASSRTHMLGTDAASRPPMHMLGTDKASLPPEGFDQLW